MENIKDIIDDIDDSACARMEAQELDPEGYNRYLDEMAKAEEIKREMPAESIGDILLTAHELINGDRLEQYGNPEKSFQRIAEYWTSYLRNYDIIQENRQIYPDMVAMMMVLFKLARYQGSWYHHEDSIVDMAGYLGLFDFMAKRRPE